MCQILMCLCVLSLSWPYWHWNSVRSFLVRNLFLTCYHLCLYQEIAFFLSSYKLWTFNYCIFFLVSFEGYGDFLSFMICLHFGRFLLFISIGIPWMLIDNWVTLFLCIQLGTLVALEVDYWLAHGLVLSLCSMTDEFCRKFHTEFPQKTGLNLTTQSWWSCNSHWNASNSIIICKRGEGWRRWCGSGTVRNFKWESSSSCGWLMKTLVESAESGRGWRPMKLISFLSTECLSVSFTHLRCFLLRIGPCELTLIQRFVSSPHLHKQLLPSSFIFLSLIADKYKRLILILITSYHLFYILNII